MKGFKIIILLIFISFTANSTEKVKKVGEAKVTTIKIVDKKKIIVVGEFTNIFEEEKSYLHGEAKIEDSDILIQCIGISIVFLALIYCPNLVKINN